MTRGLRYTKGVDHSFAIRRAVPEDLPAMFAVSSAAHLASYGDILDPSHLDLFIGRHVATPKNRRRYVTFMERHLRNRAWIMYVAEGEGAVAGYITGRHDPGGGFILRGLFVYPDFQRRGIGRKLLQTLLQDVGDTPLTLKVLKSNTAAQKLYESFGFTPQPGMVGAYYGVPEITMTRSQKQR